MLQSLFYLTTALHVSGITSTHLQENKTTVTTASGNRYTVLLSAAIVEELELKFQLLELKFQLLELKFQLLHRIIVCCYRGRVGTEVPTLPR